MSHGGNVRDFFIHPDKFIRDHPSEVATAALIAATVYTGGAAAGAWGGAAGGLGAAEAGAGAAAAAGSGLTAADYAALGLGAEAGAGAAAGAGSGLLASDYAAMGLGAGDAALGAGAGAEGLGMSAADYTSGLLGSGTSAADFMGPMTGVADYGAPDLASMSGYEGGAMGGNSASAGPQGIWEQIKGINVQKGLKGLQMANALQKLATPPRPQGMAISRPAQYQGGGGGSELARLMAMYSNPAGQARLAQLLQNQGRG